MAFMDLEKEILRKHSRAQCARIVRYINGDAARFRKLMKLFFTGEYRVVQRASWPISYCVQEKPALIKPYYKKLLLLMQKPGIHQAVVRNGVRLLQFVQVPAVHQGQVMNLCFNFIEDPQTPAAIKAFSLTVLERLSIEYPEILSELMLIIEERWHSETPAFRSRAKSIMKLADLSKTSKGIS